MNTVPLGYGVFSYLLQKKRRSEMTSQFLKNITNGQEIHPKDEINVDSPVEFESTDKKGIIGISTNGKFTFIGIGKSNPKCLVETKEEKILAYSKGEYDVKVVAPNIKKIKLKSKDSKQLTICYWDYPISSITSIITNYFKNDKITKIINMTDNLDENWNDILSISLNNSVYNNDFSIPKIQIVADSVNKDISEISSKYNFMIIKNNFDKNKREIIEDQLLISIISQNHENLNLDSNNLLIWIMKYVENFTISTGKFFTYYQDLIPDVDKKTFINFIIAHKIASLYLKVDSNKEIELVNTLNNIIESNSNTSIIIKNAILDYGLVNSTNETNKIDLNQSNFSTSYYSIYY